MASRKGRYHEVRIVVLCKNERGNVYFSALSLFQTALNPGEFSGRGSRELKSVALKAKSILEPDALLAQRIPHRPKGLYLVHRDLEAMYIQSDASDGLEPIAVRTARSLKI